MREQDGGHPPLLGDRADRVEAFFGGVVACVAVVLYVVVARSFDTPTSWIEGFSLWSSLACVWLARTENIWTMPYGLIAVILLGWFLLDIDLVGQGWLQFVFYVPVQVVGWWAWSRGGTGRTELPVTRLNGEQWALVVTLAILGWASCFFVFDWLYEESAYLLWDSSIVASSVTAQTLMSWKKRESWMWWTIPVNVSSLALFVRTESWAFVFLYAIFLFNSLLGWRDWARSESKQRV
jgi:nicotinamide mononucleotide transporter